MARMPYAGQTGQNLGMPIDPGNQAGNIDALIQTLNGQVGAFSPNAATVSAGSDTTVDVAFTDVIPANGFLNGGDKYRFTGFGTTGPSTHSKSVVVSLYQGTLTVSTALASSTASAGNWQLDNFDLIWDGTTFRYGFGIEYQDATPLNLRTLGQGSYGTTFTNTLALSVQLGLKTGTAASTDIGATWFGGEIIR